MVFSEDTVSSRYIAKYKPPMPVFACTSKPRTIRELTLTRSLKGELIQSFHGIDNLIMSLINKAKKKGIAKPGGKVICLHGTKEDQPEMSNVIKIIEVN